MSPDKSLFYFSYHNTGKKAGDGSQMGFNQKYIDSMGQDKVEAAVRTLLEAIGENPDRVGLKDTPKRVANMFREIFRGYDESNKPKIAIFPNGEDGLSYDEMVNDAGDFYSHCEHHMVPFFGKYWFSYIPSAKGNLLGLSKVARVMDFFAAKVQIQERIAEEVCGLLWEALCENVETPPLGMALVLEATHLCKTMRGVKKKGVMRTVKLIGKFKEDAAVREEFLSFVNARTSV